MQWYYANSDQRLGPVSEAEFNRLVAAGVIVATTLVWNQSMTAWAPYAQVAVPPPISSAGGGATGAADTEICAVNGKRYPRREMIFFEGKWISAENRDVFFQRQREGLSGIGREFVYGGFWIRFVAKFIDLLILGVAIVVLVMIGSVIVAAGRSAAPAGFAEVLMVLFFVLGFLGLGIGYHWYFLEKFQATPGKMALGLIVVRSDGSKLSRGRIIGRFFGEILTRLVPLSIGYIIAGFDNPQKRALHDHLCDTRVIKK